MIIERYKVEERRREKQASREADDRALANGEISAQDLARRNGVFSALSVSNSSIRRPRRYRLRA